MVCRAYARHLVTAEEQGVLPFVGQRLDEPLRKIVVDCIFTVILVSEDLCPKVVKVSHRTPHQVSVLRSAVGKHLVKLVSHLLLDVLRIFRVSEELYILRTEPLSFVAFLSVYGSIEEETVEDKVCKQIYCGMSASVKFFLLRVTIQSAQMIIALLT